LEYLNLAENRDIQDISFLKDLKELKTLNLAENWQINDIHFLKDLTRLQNLILKDNLHLEGFPPIFWIYYKSKGGNLLDYKHLPELPHIEKIWQLMGTKDEENINLAQQLAKGQGWMKEEFEMYKNLL